MPHVCSTPPSAIVCGGSECPHTRARNRSPAQRPTPSALFAVGRLGAPLTVPSPDVPDARGAAVRSNCAKLHRRMSWGHAWLRVATGIIGWWFVASPTVFRHQSEKLEASYARAAAGAPRWNGEGGGVLASTNWPATSSTFARGPASCRPKVRGLLGATSGSFHHGPSRSRDSVTLLSVGVGQRRGPCVLHFLHWWAGLASGAQKAVFRSSSATRGKVVLREQANVAFNPPRIAA